MVYDNLDYAQEADIFANQLKYVRPLKPFEIFMANVEAGNDNQLIIKDLVESYGIFLSYQKIPGGICAVSTLEYIFSKFGFHVLDRTLLLCIGTWEGDNNSLSANMLKGVSWLIVAFGDNLKDNIFKEKVGVFSVKELSRIAKERRTGSIGYAEAMLIAYNKKMKSPLKWSNLYKVKSSMKDTDSEKDYDEKYIDDVVEIYDNDEN